MSDKIKTSQSEGQPLSPVGNENPSATTHTAEDGTGRAIDSGAKVVDDRPYSQLFQAELAAGRLDGLENANQVNKHLQGIKGASAPCTYFVNARSHGWARVAGKWVAPTPEWLKANPFVQGARAAAAKPSVGRLSDADLLTLKAQIAGQETAFAAVDGATQAILFPILEGLKGKLAAHEKAVAEEAVSSEKAKARTNAEGAFRRVLLACDRQGVNWTDAAYGFMRTMGAACNLAPEVLDACLTTLAPTTESVTA